MFEKEISIVIPEILYKAIEKCSLNLDLTVNELINMCIVSETHFELR